MRGFNRVLSAVDPRTQVVAVPADYIVYVSKISRGRFVKLPLPIDLSRADVERLYAVLLTCADDDRSDASGSDSVEERPGR